MSYSTPGLLTDESRWLAKLVRFQRMAIHNAQQGGAGTSYNTITSFGLSASDSESFAADTVHSFSFSVIQGTLSVSFDGGSTFVNYVAGQSLSIQATTTFANELQFDMSAGVGDNATLQVTTA